MRTFSEDKVFDDYENGLPDDFKIAKSKIRRRKVNLSTSTVQISIKFEYDLLQKVKEKAQEKHLPYQTFMKQILRDYLALDDISRNSDSIEQINEDELKEYLHEPSSTVFAIERFLSPDLNACIQDKSKIKHDKDEEFIGRLAA